MYDIELEDQIKAWSEKNQSENRFAHTTRVVETATALAELYAPDEVMVCRLAGWIHDAAKKYDDEKMLVKAQKYQLPITSFEWQVPMMLHGSVAYAKAATKFGLDDERIRTACTYHTSGYAEMSLLDKIVYLADKIEPERDYPNVDAIRATATEDLDAAVLMFTADNLVYLIHRQTLIDPRMIEFYNVLLESRRTSA